MLGNEPSKEWCDTRITTYGDTLTIPVIPSNLTQLSYLESSGTQYIDSGLSLPQGFTLDCKCNYLAAPTQPAEYSIIWAENAASPWGCNGVRIYFSSSGSSQNTWNLGQVSAYTGGSYSLNTDYVISASTLKTNGFLMVNGTTVISGKTTSTDLCSNNLYIFASNGAGTAKHAMSGRIYYMKIYDANGALVRDYVPVRRSSDNELGLYDKVTATLFTNQGTGTFIGGSEVSTGVARQVSSAYVGVNNIAHKVLKGYVGVNGVAHLFYDASVYYNYGDGSLNQTVNSYVGNLYINGALCTNPSTRTYSYGNYYMTVNWENPDSVNDNNPLELAIYNNADIVKWGRTDKTRIITGLNNYSLVVDATSEDKTCLICIRGGGGTTSVKVGEFTFQCNGSSSGITLSDMVSQSIIKPLVIISCSANSTSYAYSDILSCYNNASFITSSTKSYPEVYIAFMLNQGNTIESINVYSSRSFNNTYDGLGYMIAPTDLARLTLNAY